MQLDEKMKKIAVNVGSNLKRLIAQNKTTQKKLAELLDVAPASMTEYCNGRAIPSVRVFIDLKEMYNINIDEFLMTGAPASNDGEDSNARPVPENLSTYEKYCGLYIVYYFDTGRYKGRDTQTPKESVTFGLLYIYKSMSSLGIPEYKCIALLGIKSREEAEEVKAFLANAPYEQTVISAMKNSQIGNVYLGSLEMSQDHVFIELEHGNTDKAYLIVHRVENNKGNYIGGIGTVNSISKGRERAPVVQYMGLSRNKLSMSVEEIHHCLLLGTPNVNMEAETEEIIRTFKALYMDPGETLNEFTEYQKTVMVRSMLERYVRKSLERNMFRYGKVSANDDDEWYQAIKEAEK